jgi:hypothetical protein
MIRPFAILAGVAALAAAGSQVLEVGPPGAIEWHGGIDAGLEAARASGKPLWIVFRCER